MKITAPAAVGYLVCVAFTAPPAEANAVNGVVMAPMIAAVKNGDAAELERLTGAMIGFSDASPSPNQRVFAPISGAEAIARLKGCEAGEPREPAKGGEGRALWASSLWFCGVRDPNPEKCANIGYWLNAAPQNGGYSLTIARTSIPLLGRAAKVAGCKPTVMAPPSPPPLPGANNG